MYVGHSLLAFALGAFIARRAGVRRSLVLPIGLLAAGFAVLPDVDTTYTVYAVLRAGPENLFPTPQYVWTAEAWRVHRALTHSLLVGGVASLGAGALGFAIERHRDPSGGQASNPAVVAAAAVGLVAFGGILAAGLSTDGAAGLATAGLYVAGGLLLVAVAIRRGVPARWLGGAAAVGLLTHPFGDLFMGRPPAFLYPLSTTPPIAKVAVAPDPTVNLVALFGLELALAWAAVRTVATHRGWRIGEAVEPQALVALGFAGAVLVIQPPTLQVAYHFALGTIATGLLLGVVPGVVRGRASAGGDRVDYRTGVVTGLSAVSLAVVAYLLAYLTIGG